MSAVVTIPLVRDAVDSHYQYVKTRALAQMALIAPTVQSIFNGQPVPFTFGGIAQARDWPMPEAALNVPYLLLKEDDPIPFGGSVSQFSPQLKQPVVWVWMVQGDNTPTDAQAANRGNKYGINMAIIQAIAYGCFPGFTEKLQWGVKDDGTGTPVSTSISYSPQDFVRWTLPKFVDKIDRTTGILFCSGNVTLVSFSPEITS